MVNATAYKESNLPEWLIQGQILWNSYNLRKAGLMQTLTCTGFQPYPMATPSTDSSHVLWRTLLKYIQEVIKHFLMSQERTEVRKTSVQRTVL